MAGYNSLVLLFGAGTTPDGGDPDGSADGLVDEGLQLFIEMLSGFKDAGVDVSPGSEMAQFGEGFPDGSLTATMIAALRGGEILPADASGADQPDGIVKFDAVPEGDGWTTTVTVFGIDGHNESAGVSVTAPTVREATQEVVQTISKPDPSQGSSRSGGGIDLSLFSDDQSGASSPGDTQEWPAQSAGGADEDFWVNITLPNGSNVTIHRGPRGIGSEFDIPFFLTSTDLKVLTGSDPGADPGSDPTDPRVFFWTGSERGLVDSPEPFVIDDEGSDNTVSALGGEAPPAAPARLYSSYFDLDPELTVDEGKPEFTVATSEEPGQNARGCFRLAWIVGPVIAALIGVGGAVWLLGGGDDPEPAAQVVTSGDEPVAASPSPPPAGEGGAGEVVDPGGGALSGDPLLVHPCDVLTAQQITAVAGNKVSAGVMPEGETRTDGSAGGGRQTCFWKADGIPNGNVWISVAGPFPIDDTFDWVAGQAPDPVITNTDLPYTDLGEIRMEVTFFEDTVGRDTIESATVDGYVEAWYVHGDTGKGVKILASIENRPEGYDALAPEPEPELDAYQTTLEAAACSIHEALAAAQRGALSDRDSVDCGIDLQDDLPDPPPDDEKPQVQLFALARPAQIAEPGTVKYWILATNSGTVTWTASALSDSVYGNLQGGAGFVTNTCNGVNWVVGPGLWQSCTAEVDVTGPIPSDQTSTIRIDVVDGDGDTASALQGMLVRIDSTPGPELGVEKVPSEASIPATGQEVDFTVRVRNTTGETVVVSQLFDDVFGDVADPENASLTTTTCDSVDRQLGPQEVFECVFAAFVTPPLSGEDHRNTLFAQATIDDEPFTSGEATAIIEVEG